MRNLTDFLKDQLLYTIIMILTAVMIIGYYVMTVGKVGVIYPILIAAFFYLCYLVIAFYKYAMHRKTLDRLMTASVSVKSGIREYQRTYDVICDIYRRYGRQFALLQEKTAEDKRFISAYIHNLKTPVTVCSLILQRAGQGEIQEKEALEQIHEEMNRLNAGLNMLLDIKRLEELQSDYRPQAQELSSLVNAVINNNKALFIHSKVFPKFEATEKQVYTDEKWNAVLLNQIISNAIKYSADNTPKHLYFSIGQEGEYTTLQIRDEGIGIPEYDLPKVFDAFFTGENGRRGYNSSGIGLYLCRKICNQLGQKIRIENENGCKVTISYLSKL